MNLLRRLFAPRASATSDLKHPTAWLSNALGATPTTSGQSVSPSSAMTYGPYFAAVTVISEDVAKVPVSAVESAGGARRPLADDPVTRIFSEEFNPNLAAFVGRETLTQWALGWGDGLAEIQRTTRGDPVALHPIHPSRIVDLRVIDGEMRWVIRTDDLDGGGRALAFSLGEIFHLRGPGDQWRGFSRARLARESVGLGLAAQTFGSSFFANDAAVGIVVTFPNRMDAKDRDSFREHLQTAYQGAKGTGRPLVMDNGGKVDRLGIPPEDAQYLQTREFQVEEIARWFRVSPLKIGHQKRSPGWSTLEATNTDHVVDCLMPWALRWEAEAKRKLLRDRPGVTLKHYFQGLMRGDSVARSGYYRTLIFSGVMTPNEARALEDVPPSSSPNADRLIVQTSMGLLDDLGREPAATATFGTPLPPDDPEPPGEEPDADDAEDDGPDEEAQAAAPAVPDAVYGTLASRVASKESKAYARHAAKHAEDPPAFQKWVRSFYAEMAADLEREFACVARDAAVLKRWAADTALAAAKGALASFSHGGAMPDESARAAAWSQSAKESL